MLAKDGDVGDKRSLRRAQLYFTLCQLPGYRKWARLAVDYASWAVWSLLGNLVSAVCCMEWLERKGFLNLLLGDTNPPRQVEI